jgi:hypothetical protein
MYLLIEYVNPKELGKSVAKALIDEFPHILHNEKEVWQWLNKAKTEGISIKLYKLGDCLVNWE